MQIVKQGRPFKSDSFHQKNTFICAIIAGITGIWTTMTATAIWMADMAAWTMVIMTVTAAMPVSSSAGTIMKGHSAITVIAAIGLRIAMSAVTTAIITMETATGNMAVMNLKAGMVAMTATGHPVTGNTIITIIPAVPTAVTSGRTAAGARAIWAIWAVTNIAAIIVIIIRPGTMAAIAGGKMVTGGRMTTGAGTNSVMIVTMATARAGNNGNNGLKTEGAATIRQTIATVIAIEIAEVRTISVMRIIMPTRTTLPGTRNSGNKEDGWGKRSAMQRELLFL
jgi:hypothetical protein